jgi:WD40 repeat protein
MSRRNVSLALVLLLALASILLNIVTNDLSGGSTATLPLLRGLRDYALPALLILLVVLLVGQGALFVISDRPRRRAWTGQRPPYPGLEPFTEEDAAVYFGRDEEVRELVGRLSPALEHEAHRFVTVAGPSGSGKSSLVHAGLLPALARQRRRWVVVPTFEPEDRPLRNLARSLAVLLPGLDVEATTTQLREDHGALIDALEELRLGHGGRSASVLIVMDQAEELATLAAEAERDAVLGLLRAALAADRRLWVVAALRSEFLDELLNAGWADLLHQPMVVGPPGRAALYDMIQLPAAQAGVEFATGLVSRMVDDTGGGDGLPMLAYTLQALYQRAGTSGRVSFQDYERLGGVAGALSAQADRVASELAVGPGRAPVVETLLRFVSFDESGPVRRRLPRSALNTAERRVVDAFIRARLLTSDTDVVQVAHEALFRQWPPLRHAVEAGAEALRLRAQLERWALDWERSGRRDSYLLIGERLELARTWARADEEMRGELPVVAEFLEQSIRLDRTALTRLSQAVAQRSLASRDYDPELATLLAVSAVEECALTPLASRALVTAVTNLCQRVLRGHRDGCWGADWAPDGRRLATTSGDLTTRVWDTERGIELMVLRGHDDGVRKAAWSADGEHLASIGRDGTLRVWTAAGGLDTALTLSGRPRDVAWSPDGGYLVVALEDGTARVWDLARRREALVLSGHEDWVRGVAWSPDGRLIGTASQDRTARLWDADTGTQRQVLSGHGDGVLALAWSPGGRRLATASADRTASVWRAAGGTELAVLQGHQDAVLSVAWSPDGRRLVTGSDDRTARIWESARGGCLAVLQGHRSSVRGAAWSVNGRRLATVSEDRTARVWETEACVEIAVLRGHETTVQAVAWSPEGRRLASASRDRTVRVWDAEQGAELLRLEGHSSTVRAVDWSPEGRRLATASQDRTARVWDVTQGTLLATLSGHADILRSVAWSPDGRRLLTGSEDRTGGIWDAATGAPIARLRGHADRVRASAWAPDGRRVATGSRDGTARIWDADSGEPLLELSGHQASLRGLAWAPEGRRLATVADDGTARVWDAERGDQVAVLRGHEDFVRGVAWAPDGRRLVTASSDRTVRTWDVECARELALIGVHDEMAECVAWSPEGARVASGSRDGTVRVWDATADVFTYLAAARLRVARRLTAEERRDVMLP